VHVHGERVFAPTVTESPRFTRSRSSLYWSQLHEAATAAGHSRRKNRLPIRDNGRPMSPAGNAKPTFRTPRSKCADRNGVTSPLTSRSIGQH
jgi:hypothetical protein